MAFRCETCGASFDVPAQSLAKYPGWKPKYCREHSPKRATTKAPRRSGGAGRSFASKEENLTVQQVLERYTEGPRSGVFTDGSSVPNPGPGGWGAVWVEDGEVREQRHGEDPQTTNNRMELRALVEAYRMLPEDAATTVYTDSKLCVDTITKWAPGWEKRGWKRKGGAIQNLELVQELLALYRVHENCPLEWIAAHSGNRWNEYADSLSTAWMRETL